MEQIQPFLHFLAPNQTGKAMDKIERVEERIDVEKRLVHDGCVRVHTSTTAVEEIAEADLERVTVTVERIPIDREVLSPPKVRVEGDTTIIPIFEERLIVEKRLVLVEEVRVTRQTSSQLERIPVSIRKQSFTVERSNPTEKGELS